MWNRLRFDPSHSHHEPVVMGILNVTPDSFSDGGLFLRTENALVHASRMIEDGADIIDVGPESTRPGAKPVAVETQLSRALPVIAAIRERHPDVAISIDTQDATVAREAIHAGADIINDISALRHDRDMVDVAAHSGAGVVLMHMRGTPENMQHEGGPYYTDLVAEICTFLEERARYAESNGIDPSRIVLDPGIGFGKRAEDNLTILSRMDRFVALGKPVLVGASRKSFMATQMKQRDSSTPRPANARLSGSIASAVVAALGGAAILRVHDVRETVEAIRLCSAISQATEHEVRTTAIEK